MSGDSGSDGYQNPYQAPTASYQAPLVDDGYRPKRASFLLLLCLGVIGFVAMVVASFGIGYAEESGNDELMGILTIPMLAGMALFIWQYIMVLIYLYRGWKLVDDTAARTTPGKAVGFLFIPIYNLYWLFQAWYGLAVDYNTTATRRGTELRLPEGIFQAFCILSIVNAIPVVNYLSMIPSLVLGLMVWWNLCKLINYHADA